MAKKKRILVILNPAAGRGRGQRFREQVENELAGLDVDADIASTGGPGDAARLAASAVGAVDSILGAGGDGTLNEIVRGILFEKTRRPAIERPAVGMVPIGTVNHGVHAFSMPRRLRDLVNAAADEHTREIDIGIVKRSGKAAGVFALWLGAGFDAAVVRAVSDSRAGPLTTGVLHYVVPAIRAFATYPFAPIRGNVDGVPLPPCGQVFVANVNAIASFMRLVKSADPCDGQHEVVALSPGSKFGMVRLGVASSLGRLERSRNVLVVKGACAALTAQADVPVQVDGEAFGALPVETAVEPRAIRVIVGSTLIGTRL